MHEVHRVLGNDPGLTDLAALFEAYRRHYDQPPDESGSLAWVSTGVLSGALHAFLAAEGGTPAGMAIAVSTPASLRLGHFWQLRDLFVAEGHRGHGVGRRLVSAVCEAARADGALRVALTTEDDNAAAHGLYASLGFEPMPGYVGMALALPAALPAEPRRR